MSHTPSEDMREPHDIEALEALRGRMVAAARELGPVEPERRGWRARWRGWRRASRASVVALAILAGAGAVAGAAELISVGEPLPEAKPGIETLAPPPGGRVAVVATAPDPERGLHWGVGTYERDGVVCALVGQVRVGRLGRQAGETFRPLAARDGGACGRVGAPLLYDRRTFPGPQARTLLFGRARPDVDEVRIVAGAPPRSARPARDGAFLFVFRGRLTGDPPVLRGFAGGRAAPSRAP